MFCILKFITIVLTQIFSIILPTMYISYILVYINFLCIINIKTFAVCLHISYFRYTILVECSDPIKNVTLDRNVINN